jgi:hypothetical protein
MCSCYTKFFRQSWGSGGLVSPLGGPASDLSIGNHSSTSKVKLVAQLISTQTGEVLKSFEAHSEISDGGYSVQGGETARSAEFKSGANSFSESTHG